MRDPAALRDVARVPAVEVRDELELEVRGLPPDRGPARRNEPGEGDEEEKACDADLHHGNVVTEHDGRHPTRPGGRPVINLLKRGAAASRPRRTPRTRGTPHTAAFALGRSPGRSRLGRGG